jgi:signal transduction histidine kinase
MTGFSRGELLQKTCIELTAPEDKEKSKKALELVLEKGHLENHEKTCIVNYGKVIITNMSICLLPDKKRYLLVTKDISSLKLLESQEKLASMGEMIGNIAHQWRQPLSVISSFASGIALKKEFGTLKDEDIIPYMNQIVEQTKYLSTIINDFRNLIKGGNEEEKLNIFTLLEKTLSIVAPDLKCNDIELITNIDATLEIIGYENELIHSFINIINNSKDALVANENIEDKYIFIDASLNDNQYEIIIKDNGGGITSSVLSRIFEPYFTTKHQSQGTGLGLSMTYKIITEIHKGTISASNSTFEYNGKEYTGAKFKITLPVI